MMMVVVVIFEGYLLILKLYDYRLIYHDCSGLLCDLRLGKLALGIVTLAVRSVAMMLVPWAA